MNAYFEALLYLQRFRRMRMLCFAGASLVLMMLGRADDSGAAARLKQMQGGVESRRERTMYSLDVGGELKQKCNTKDSRGCFTPQQAHKANVWTRGNPHKAER